MPNLRFANLSSLHLLQAQMYRDGASNNKIYFLTEYQEILSIEKHQVCIIGSKVTTFLLNLTERWVSCTV